MFDWARNQKIMRKSARHPNRYMECIQTQTAHTRACVMYAFVSGPGELFRLSKKTRYINIYNCVDCLRESSDLGLPLIQMRYICTFEMCGTTQFCRHRQLTRPETAQPTDRPLRPKGHTADSGLMDYQQCGINVQKMNAHAHTKPSPKQTDPVRCREVHEYMQYPP